MTLDAVQSVNNESDEAIFDFRFKAAFRRANTDISHERQVYTILEYAGDVGGLNDAMALLFMPILSIWTPALLAQTILNQSFTY